MKFLTYLYIFNIFLCVVMHHNLCTSNETYAGAGPAPHVLDLIGSRWPGRGSCRCLGGRSCCLFIIPITLKSPNIICCNSIKRSFLCYICSRNSSISCCNNRFLFCFQHSNCRIYCTSCCARALFCSNYTIMIT